MYTFTTSVKEKEIQEYGLTDFEISKRLMLDIFSRMEEPAFKNIFHIEKNKWDIAGEPTVIYLLKIIPKIVEKPLPNIPYKPKKLNKLQRFVKFIFKL